MSETRLKVLRGPKLNPIYGDTSHETLSIPLGRERQALMLWKYKSVLAGFRGTLWDGIFGPGTELQVMTFQRDYVRSANPNRIVDHATWDGPEKFAMEFSIDLKPSSVPVAVAQDSATALMEESIIRKNRKSEFIVDMNTREFTKRF